MPVIISNGTTSLGTTNGFYRVEAHNLGCFGAILALTTTRYIDVTFANSGNCQGIVIELITTSMTSRQVRVRLQENTGSWTTRAEVTLLTEDITGGLTNASIYKYRGQYTTPVFFSTPYAVDTSANKWRFEIAHSSGTGTWNLRTSDGTNPFYATWCDNQVSFADNDVIICKDKVTIDQTATIGAALGTGDSANGIGAVLCTSHADPSPANVARLEWQNPPTSAYSLTLRGQVIMGSYSGFRAGTPSSRIPIAQKATITFGSPAAGTASPRFVVPTGTASTTYGGLSSLFLYGEIPAYQKTHLTADAATDQAKLNVVDNVNWVNGDSVVVGKQDTRAQGVLTVHTISSVSGSEITLTANLATNARKGPTDGDSLGGTVLKLESHGILVTSASAQIPLHSLGCMANLEISGVDLFNQRFTTSLTTYYYFLAALDADYTNPYLFQDIAAWTDSNSVTYLYTDLAAPKGILMERVYCFRQNMANGCVYYAANRFKSGRTTIKDCICLSQYGSTISTATNIRLTLEGNRFENARASTYFWALTGMEGEFLGNYMWGSGTAVTAGCVQIRQCVNPLKIEDNIFENNNAAMVFAATPNVNCLDQNAQFVNNVVDIGFLAEAFPSYTFDSPQSESLVIDETYVPDMVVGGRVGFINFNESQGEDLTMFTYGKIRKTGAGLSDETMRTAGGAALRFFPTSDVEPFAFKFDCPTGNIQGRTMTVAIWCKLNSDLYWADTHEMPRLSVLFDGDNEEFAVATATTSWQLLSVTFAPTTTTGKISIQLSGVTSATGEDALFYWDDMAILYPAGYKLDLGGLDIWDNALPVLPPIATIMSASDIWTVNTSSLTGSGSIGAELAALRGADNDTLKTLSDLLRQIKQLTDDNQALTVALR